MNYRHAYHAGNFADVMKHLALALILDHLKKKDAPFCVIDAHGGIGLYDLKSEESQKTKEWEAGIGRFSGIQADSDFTLYWNAVKPFLNKGQYPGSPLLIANALRSQDRLVANELHPDDVETLKTHLHRKDNVRVSNLDAYECIRSQIPPKEKRGLVLIDPPFEERDEFETLSTQMEEWKKRFATGIYMIWYPVKSHLAIDKMKRAALSLGLPRTWCIETMLHPRRQEDSFNGCGLIIFNTPFQIPERMMALMPLLSQKMGFSETPSAWIVPDKA